MSPGYESMARKALEILRVFHDSDLVSDQAVADYNTILRLLKESDGNSKLALVKFKETRHESALSDDGSACRDYQP